MRSWISEKDCTLKAFTDEHDPQASFYFSLLMKNRDVKINGKRAESGALLRAGDEVCYYMTKEQEAKPAFYEIYRDDNFLIVDKESGVNSEAVFALLSRTEKGGKPYFVHRLDRNTRGLLLFARNEAAYEAARQSFKERSFEKIYLAICKDRFEKDEAIAEAYLQKDDRRAIVQIGARKIGGAEKIVTEYRVLQRNNGLALVQVRLHTGKTHQIRAHLAYLGCPVLGDTKYGDKPLNSRYLKTRQCLVAKRLTLHFSATSLFAYAEGKTFVSSFDLSLDEL